jgi:hypothetical protein
MNNRALATLTATSFAAVAYPEGNPKIYHGFSTNPVVPLAGRPLHTVKRSLAALPKGVQVYAWPGGRVWPVVYTKTGPCTWKCTN